MIRVNLRPAKLTRDAKEASGPVPTFTWSGDEKDKHDFSYFESHSRISRSLNPLDLRISRKNGHAREGIREKTRQREREREKRDKRGESILANIKRWKIAEGGKLGWRYSFS